MLCYRITTEWKRPAWRVLHPAVCAVGQHSMSCLPTCVMSTWFASRYTPDLCNESLRQVYTTTPPRQLAGTATSAQETRNSYTAPRASLKSPKLAPRSTRQGNPTTPLSCGNSKLFVFYAAGVASRAPPSGASAFTPRRCFFLISGDMHM